MNNLETYTKNPILAKVFRKLGYAEELGSGRKNINKYAPYYYYKFKIEVNNAERFVFSFDYQNPDETFDNTNDDMATEKSREKILELINNNPFLTQQEISEKTGLSRQGVEKNIENLKDKGIIDREGGRKEWKWIVLLLKFI